jgi:CsoR family transcriptional regulator, copper-sensing transcriptional repressor
MKAPDEKTTHTETLHRLARIGGQIEGIRRMIEEQKYCIDIITQVQAARSALRAVELQILQKHMHSCVTDAFASGTPEQADEKMSELLRVMKKQY